MNLEEIKRLEECLQTEKDAAKVSDQLIERLESENAALTEARQADSAKLAALQKEYSDLNLLYTLAINRKNFMRSALDTFAQRRSWGGDGQKSPVWIGPDPSTPEIDNTPWAFAARIIRENGG